MHRFKAAFRRLGGLYQRRKHEAEMNDELRAHLDALTERNLAAGMSAEDARFAALLGERFAARLWQAGQLAARPFGRRSSAGGGFPSSISSCSFSASSNCMRSWR